MVIIMIKFTNSKMNQFTYKDWIRYFKRNDKHRLALDFSREKGLSQKVMDMLFPSIQAFQKGEGSDGSYLMKTVEKFIEKSGETDCREAMMLFIKEENQHSAYLKQYMDHYQIDVAEKSFLDTAFRKLRQLGGLKCEITVLVTAEIIALTYYNAIFNCTGSRALRGICNQMMHDELRHIMFQSHTLSHFKVHAIDRVIRILIMRMTSVFVWAAFHNVFQAGGYSYFLFMRENLEYLHQSIYLTEKSN